MENFTRARVRARLDALGITAVEAARRAGTRKEFIYELLNGKKEQVRPGALLKLAAALDCDPEYLVGAQPTPRTGAAQEGRVPVEGIVEANAWRRAGSVYLPADLPVRPDPRFSADRQVVYLARGDGAREVGIGDGDVLLVLRGGPVRAGDVALYRREREPGEAEISARRVADEARPGAEELLGRVLLSIKVF